jgi:hypothetical protein
MDNWRPGRISIGQPDRVLGCLQFPLVSFKDRPLLVPLVMLNACLTFSWPNKVPFDHEAEKLFRPSRLPTMHYTGAGVVGHQGVMVSPRCVLAIGRPLGTVVPGKLKTLLE